MKAKTIAVAFLFGCILLASTIYAYLMGRKNVWIEEFKIYDGDLIQVQHFETNLPLELKEFMKGRYYYLANKIPKSWLDVPYDYGQVSTNMRLAVGKGDAGPQYEYRVFKEGSTTFKNPETGQTNGAVSH